jgi:hypothetical protein
MRRPIDPELLISLQDLHLSRKAPEDEVAAIKRSVEHDYELRHPNSARALREADESDLKSSSQTRINSRSISIAPCV